MKNNSEEHYKEWCVEQNILQAELFEEMVKISEESLSEILPIAPDWSTWCKALCS